jgi:hypothetical protein
MSKNSRPVHRKPVAEALEPRTMMAADAAVSWKALTSQPLLGERQSLQLRFDNVGSLAGFGPYIDVVLPTQGSQGTGGVRFVSGSAVLLDTPLRETVLTFDANGRVSHPLAKDIKGSPIVLDGIPGSQLVVLELPFGSYVADQPSVQIDLQVAVDATVKLGESIQVVAAGGFHLGNDPLSNPTKDPSVRGAATSVELTPNVVNTRIEYLGPEDETTHGPNFERAYRVYVDVAQGALINQLQLKHHLDTNHAYLGLSEMTWSDKQIQIIKAPVVGETAVDSELIFGLPEIEGVAGVDGSYVVHFFVPELDANRMVVIDPVKAAPTPVVFTADAKGEWIKTPAVGTSNAVIESVQTSVAKHELMAKAVATQQSVRVIEDTHAAGVGPGDVLEYTLHFQVSDYVSIENLQFETEIPNGQVLLEQHPVFFQASGVEGLDPDKALTSQIGWVDEGVASSGGQQIRFYLSKELQSVGLSGQLYGGWTEKGTKAPVVGSIQYRVRVLDAFQNAVPSGDASIDERDVFLTPAAVSAETLVPISFEPSSVQTTDTSGTRMQVATGRLQTSVYAMNGVTGIDLRQASAGDLVTYRVTRSVSSTDIEDLVLNDFLPLPVHSVASVRWVDAASKLTAGSLQLGPNDTFHASTGVTPKLELDPSNNRVSLRYGDVDSEKNQTTVIDLLLTVAIEDKPFADGMWLTQLANATFGSSNNGSASQNALTSIQYTRPVLSIVKGVTSSDNPRARLTPAGSPDANISGVDAADQIRFQIQLTNTGLSKNGAFDTLIRDVLPSGYIIPSTGLGLRVTDGLGREVRFAPEGSGGDASLFSSGLRLVDAIPSASDQLGANQVFISYTLEVSETARLNSSVSPEASIVHYAALPKGANYVTSKLADSASSRIANTSVVHSLVSTDLPQSTSNRLVVGETGTFLARVTLPEGTSSNAVVQIQAPRGLAIKELLQFTPSVGLRFTQFSVEEIQANASIAANGTDARDAGRVLTLRLGDVINSDRDNVAIETIEVLYTATVTNDLVNQTGSSLRSVASISHQSGSSTSTVALSVIEPAVEVVKTWKTPVVDAMDRVTMVLDVTVPSSSGTSAFDVTMVERMPAGVRYVPGSLRVISGNARPTAFSDHEGVLTASWDAIAAGRTCRFEYDVVVDKDVHAGMVVSTQATLQWSSLPGAPGQIASSNSLAFERTGDVNLAGGEANDYSKTFESFLTIAPVKMAMKLIESSHTFTAGSEVTIGERATFEVVATIPEGVHGLQLSGLTSRLDPTLIIESFELVSIGKNLSGSGLQLGRKGTIVGGASVAMDLGFVTNNPDNIVSADDELIFRLNTRVPNKSQNRAGQSAQADMRMDYRYGVATTASALQIVEPELVLTQTVSRPLVDANDTIDATVRISHRQSSSSAAIAVDLHQALVGSGLQFVPGSITVTNGTLLHGNQANDRGIAIQTNDLSLGKDIVIKYQLSVAKDVVPGQSFELPVSLAWYSLIGEEARAYSTNASTTIRVSSSGLIGSVFVDTNQDGGVQTGDFGLGGVAITLTGIDHLGASVSMQTVTDTNGQYRFEGLRPGEYQLTESQPEDFADGLDFAGSLGGIVSNDTISNIVIPMGSNGDYGHYRFTESPLTWISGTVFVDANQNRKLDAFEEGVAGVEMSLRGTTRLGETVERTTITNDRGYYVFGHLEPGTYSVIEGATPGFFDASEQLGNRGGQLGQDRFDSIAVTAARPADGYNFGEYRPGVIQGHVYIDFDRDGVLDRKDGLIANVKVTLTGVNDLGESIALSMATDAHGEYRFEGLRPGTYSLQSTALDGLDYSVSNVGVFEGGANPIGANGVGVAYGFNTIVLPAGAIGNAYNVGHEDPTFDPSLLETQFETVVVINGTKGDDEFIVEMTSTNASIQVNGETIALDNTETLSIRIMGSFGKDHIRFVGSENKEAIDLRRHSARITGTWFESLIYGMERIEFVGGGNEDLARFYDTPGNEVFTAQPMTAQMTGADFNNSVEATHRIYAYATSGIDTATLKGTADQQDHFHASPDAAKLYGNDFYLYTTDFDSVVGIATDVSDRAHLFDSPGADEFDAGATLAVLSGATYRSTASGYAFVRAIADSGGTDRATLQGSAGVDRLESRPLDALFLVQGTRIDAIGFERLTAHGASGSDVATVFDSHFQDTFTAEPGLASLRNSTGDVHMVGFENITVRMEAGGEDVATLRGATTVDTWKASPESWSLEGVGYAWFGSGFTKVTMFGDANDVAYLYDSAFNDLLELTPGRATLKGQRFHNEALGFGKVNSESQGGFDRVLFFDSVLRSTVRLTADKATIFGSGFSHNATGFDTLDAYYTDLTGLDNVDLNGQIEYAMLASDIAAARHKLSLRLSATAPSIRLQTRVERL